MFLIKSQLVTLNTTLRLHNNDNWNKDEWIDHTLKMANEISKEAHWC